ncbi:MAG: CAP domain-containing protein [Pyrinomonadaceae bacterium]
MKTKLFLTISLFVLSNFLFCVSSRSVFAQTIESQNKIILFVNRNDKNAAVVRPRVFKSPVRKEISDNKPTETNPAKATTNFSCERQVFEFINKKRTEISLTPLIWNDDIAKIARIHSENMASNKFFNHAGLDGSMVNNRADAIGLSKWRAIGENIAYNRGYANPLEFVVEGWMKSPAHRENILNNRWQESGIGIAITADGTYYFTQVFLLRK